jgi:hypothetical protein
MAIDIKAETVIPIAEAPKHFPGHPNVSSIYRWFGKGSRGARLETIVVGAKRYTSVEAIGRFIEATTANSVGASSPAPRPTTRQRRAAIKRAEADLAKAGI